MTTLNELRSQADEIAAAGHAGWGNTMRDAADEIDRLRTEAVAADIRIANDALVIAGLTAERDELRKSLADRDAKLSELHLQYISDFGQLQAQEPAAMYLRECADGSLVQLYDDLKPGTKLYAAAGAAGAAPVPEGWQLVPIEPTPDMCEVVTWDFNRFYPAKEIYKAMLKLAPKEQP